MEHIISTSSGDAELMEAYEVHRRNGNGDGIGIDSDTPTEAAEREGWTVIRSIYDATNQPGVPVLAEDAGGYLWVVNDIHGPWAIQVAEPSSREASL